MAVAVDGRGNAVVGGTHERDPLLDGPHARLMQVLARPGCIAEPAVVGDVEQQPRPLGAGHDRAGEDRLVADERRGRGKARHVEQWAWHRADIEAATQASELLQPDRFHLRLQRQVFAERHEVGLVVAARERAALAEHQDAVEDAPRPGRAGGRGLRPQRSRDEESSGRQGAADGGAHVGVVERQEGHGGFGPDHVRDAGEVVRLSGGAGGRQGEVVEEDAALVLGAPLLPLAYARLHDADLDVRRGRLRPERQAGLAEQGHDGERHQGNGKRGSSHAPPVDAGGRLAPQHRRQGKDEDGCQREPVDADDGRALHQGKRIGQRVAERVPGEAAQDMAAQPFRGRQRQGQHEDAAGAAGPEARGDPGGRGVEEGKAGGKQGDGEGQQHRERLGLDQEGLADPEQSRHEVAEPEPPADPCRGDFRATVPARSVIPALRG